MNKSQVIKLIDDTIRKQNYTTPMDELFLISELLIQSPYFEKYSELKSLYSHLKGIISLELEARNLLTQQQLSEIYDEN